MNTYEECITIMHYLHIYCIPMCYTNTEDTMRNIAKHLKIQLWQQKLWALPGHFFRNPAKFGPINF